MRSVRLVLICAVAALVVPVLLLSPAGAASSRVPYSLVVDIVRGHEAPTGPLCVQTSVYKTGELVVWRVEVRDAATGRPIGDNGAKVAEIAERGLKVTAYLENGKSFELKYGAHPPRVNPGEKQVFFFTGSWLIPADHPTGTLRWWVIATDKAKAFVRWDPLGAGTSLPSSRITIEKR